MAREDGKLLENLPALWEETNLEEQRQILLTCRMRSTSMPGKRRLSLR